MMKKIVFTANEMAELNIDKLEYIKPRIPTIIIVEFYC